MNGRVAVIIYRIALVGGAERLAREQVREMQRRGIKAELIVLNKKSTEGTVIEVKSLFDVRGIRALALHLRGFDTVVTHMWFANTVGRIASLIARVPIRVAFEHDIARKDVKTWNMLLIDKFLKRFSKIVAVSDDVRKSLAERGLKGLHVLENGIDFKRIQEAPRLDLSAYERPIYFFAARLIHQKAADVAIEAFKTLEKGTLLIAGEGEEETHLRGIASGASVVFLGPRSDVPSLMKSSDYFIFPSRYDARPIVVLEAMASGVPMIVSEYPTLPRVLRDYARTFPVDNVRELARAMREEPKNRTVDLAPFTIESNVDGLLAIIAERR